MNSRNELGERRNQKRFRVLEGAFAVFRPQFTKLGQITDISRGGLALRYPITGNHSKGSFELDIFLSGNGFCLERVPIKTVSDIQMAKRFSTSSIPMRRCGVQFGELTKSQISQLEYFIQNNTTKKV
jgi:hypothetical protein